MKSLLLFLCMFAVGAVFAEGPIVDPTRVATKTMTCFLPTEYTDNTPLDANNIMSVNFFRSNTSTGPWQIIGQTMGGICAWVEDINLLPVGQYYYHATVTDNLGLESEMSNIIPLEVKIALPPKPPTSLGWAD